MNIVPRALVEAHQTGPEIHREIDALRKTLDGNLVIMGHHYQWDDVIEHVDRVGDSLELSRMVEHISAEHIVFCGVHFMAETACMLAREGQNVHLPAVDADCVMAEMVPAALLENVLRNIEDTGRRIVPLAYVNTPLAVKAVVGAHGGAVCTSANARQMMEWAMERGDGVLFLPDYKLGNNTANQLGLPQEDRHVLDIRRGGAHLDMAAVKEKKLLLWPGCCAVHAPLGPPAAARMREHYPGARILVHPECSPEMVHAADGAGSTSYLIREVEQAAEGSVFVIGTEINLVNRLAEKHRGRVTVVPLVETACSNMAKVHARNLLGTLRGIVDGSARPMVVDAALVPPARESVARMLAHTASGS